MNIDVLGLLLALLIGAIAGYLAGQIVKGHGFGTVGNIVVGIVGSLLFGVLFGSFNFLNSAMLNEIVGGTLGAVILLFAIGLVKKTV
ncbi:GlsB/YeaQ/YmgE family stress response membrane protein [Paludisphaera rhizosphaerae]|uniref:GlsB/YeaQ/YmgE family stress response membrane protein n=1 Tax=Paludisphaera rhizosphaerae TaxID=2711216 RepID=UPI0013ED9C51|nr:GlsB/YeaQ/YmgE family stress response membrane protein [Paludisphaera rhizosphaerae]